MMTDNSIMPNGKYKATRLGNVPAEYLLKIYENKSVKGELYDYIEQNLQRIKDGNTKQETGFLCPKVTYYCEKVAKDELKRVRSKYSADKKPIRVYECPDCGGWHLTSKPKVEKYDQV